MATAVPQRRVRSETFFSKYYPPDTAASGTHEITQRGNTTQACETRNEKEGCPVRQSQSLEQQRLNKKKSFNQIGQTQSGHAANRAHSSHVICSQTPSSANAAVAPSLSDLVKAAKNELSNSLGKALVKSDSPGPALSLADLASQHKSKLAKNEASKDASPSVSQKVQDSMVSLSSKVAQFSAQKKNPAHSLLNTVSLEKDCDKSPRTVSVNLVIGSSSADSLVCPAKDSSQSRGNTATDSLLQLAMQHKKSGHTNKFHAGQNVTDLLVPQIKNMNLVDKKPKHLSISESSISVNSLNVPLMNCLKTKTKGKSVMESGKLELEEITGRSSLFETPSHPDVAPVELYPDTTELAVNEALISEASSLGLVLCCMPQKRKFENSLPPKREKALKYPKFSCSRQVGQKILYPESVMNKIQPFDFSTPSPDDIVRANQKQAFTRSDKEFQVPGVKDVCLFC